MRGRHPIRRAAPAAAAALLALLALAPAARADVTVTSSLGFEGGWVGGAVTPVRLELSSSEKSPVTCVLTIRPGRGGMGGGGLSTETTVFLAPGARKRLTLPVLAGAFVFDGEWRIDIRTDRKVLLRHGTRFEESDRLEDVLGGQVNTAAFDSSNIMVAVLGVPAGGCAWMGEIPESAPEEFVRKRQWRGVYLVGAEGKGNVAVPAFAGVDLPAAPDPWICYEGFEALLWIDPDPDPFQDPAQLEAVLGHALHGGRLLVALTPGSRIPAGSPLARALPVTLAGHDDVPGDQVLAGVLGMRPRGSVSRAPLPVARLTGVGGRVLRRLEDGRPLVVAADYGLGTVVVFAFDPRALSFSGIEDRALLLGALLGPAAAPGPEEDQYLATSLSGIIGHLRKRFMTPPPLGLLVLGLAAYVLAIGPVDYFLLKRRKKLRRTVVTFPSIVIAFTLLAWGASFLLFGGKAGMARVAILDFALSPGRDADVYRGIDFLGSYSPTGTNLDASWETSRSFVGFPWLASGATYGNMQETSSLEGRVRVGPDGRPSVDLDIPLRSHRTVQARFSGEVPVSLEASVAGTGNQAVLEIVNRLPLPLHDLQVVWKGWTAPLGELGAGDRVSLPLNPAVSPWKRLRASLLLPLPTGGGGLFSGEDPFVPRDGTPAALAAARTSMARATAGAGFATALTAEGLTAGRYSRVLDRQGLDLSRQAAEGRPVVVGWCEGDPLGVMPHGEETDSTVVVVRRVAATVDGAAATVDAKEDR